MSSEYLKRRAAPSSAVSEVAEMGLLSFSALTKHIKVDPKNLASVKALQGPLGKLGHLLASLQSLELYKDWAPLRSDVYEALHVPKEQAYSNSKQKEETNAGKALQDEGTWTSSSGRNHHWGVKFPESATLARITFEIKPNQAPQKLEVHVDEGTGSKEDFKLYHEVTFKADTPTTTTISLPSPVVCKGVKLTYSGNAASNNSNSVGLTKIAFFHCRPKASYLTSSDALTHLRDWITSMVDVADANVRDLAFKALLELTTTTGSFNTLLHTLHALLKNPNTKLDDATKAAGLRLLTSMHTTLGDRRHETTTAEYTIKAASGGASGPDYGEIEGVAYDPSSSHTGITFTENNTVATSSTSSNTHAVLNVGPFTSGKAAWSFKLIEDTDSQCSCFGAAIKPVSNSSYEYSKQLYMYRAFNGNAYTLGSCDRYGNDGDRVRKGSTIRFDVDFETDDGEIRASIDDRPIGVVFKGIKGKEIWPAIAFYSSNRTVGIVHVEGPASVAKACGLKIKGGRATTVDTSSSTPASGSIGFAQELALSAIDPLESAVGKGVLGRGGKLGYSAGSDGADAKVKVAGAATANALSMHPFSADGDSTAASDVAADVLSSLVGADRDESVKASAALTSAKFAKTAYATYWIGKQFDTFSGSVALDDSATESARPVDDTAESSSPVYFEVYGDNKLLWRSNAFHNPGTPAQTFSVVVRDANVLRLVTRVVKGNAGAHAVWVNPSVRGRSVWGFYGWRNLPTADADAITGIPRGDDFPLPTLSEITLHSAGDLAHALANFVGLLSFEYLRAMRFEAALSEGAAADLEQPYVLEPAETTFATLQGLVKHLTKNQTPENSKIAAALIQALTANLRRATYSRVNPLNTGLFKKEEDKKKKKDDKDADKAVPLPLIAEVANEVRAIVNMASGAGAVDTLVKDAAAQFVDLTRSFFTTDKVERLQIATATCGSAGTVEIQLEWPCEHLNTDSTLLQLESVVLQLRLYAQNVGCRCKVLGRWPAKIYLVLEVTENLPGFLEEELAEMFSNVDLPDWWLGNEAADLLPLKLEASATWNRKKELPVASGIGAVRVYPSVAGSFDDVVKHLQAFLPKDVVE